MSNLEALDYLRKYGYISDIPAEEAAALGITTTEAPPNEFVRVALQEFQTMALIPVTGELDKATQDAMARPRCGFRDRGTIGLHDFATAEEFVEFGTRWPHVVVTYSFENDTPDLDQQTQRRIVRTAFDRWTAVVPLEFREVPANQEADIQILYASGAHGGNQSQDPAFDGASGVLAHAFFPPPNAGDLAGDVHFDEDERWQEGFAANGVDLLTVSVHELGHSLGLRHTSAPNSTMNPFYPTPNIPATDDRAGMKRVYREHIWIASLYRDLLGRRFDVDGLDFWVRQRFGAASPDGIARGFCYSAEFSGQLATRLYFTLLDRAPDPEGLAFWSALLRSGVSRQSVMIGFLQSAEYLSNNPAPEDFVRSLYRRLFDRLPDPEGFAFWVDQMNRGLAPRDVANGFLASEEFARRIVQEQYQRLLRRDPDAAGWQSWASRIRAGFAHQDLIAGIVASAEYRDSAEGWW